MFNYYSDDIIPIILKRFKVNSIVICGLSEIIDISKILKYCEDNNASYVVVDFKEYVGLNCIRDYPLNALSNLNNFDAIFINDDSNWYTVFNELDIIKNNNDEFPLVFICNNIFPFKRRDSYIDPKRIPNDFLNEYSREFSCNGINLIDDTYHAIEENTPNNGVLTAIEDFLSKNQHISVMDIKLINGITILCSNNSISKIRLGMLSEDIKGYESNYGDFSDHIMEKKLLINYIDQSNILSDDIIKLKKFQSEIEKKDEVIMDYETKINLHDSELNLINSQLNNLSTKLDLKDVKIRSMHSKLVNSQNEVNKFNNKLKDKDGKINYLNNLLSEKETEISSLKKDILAKESKEVELRGGLAEANNKIKDNSVQLTCKNNSLIQKENMIKIKQKELDESNSKLNSLKKRYECQLFKLDNNEYCISCYKEKIFNNSLEIQYLKRNSFIKKILSPLAYFYLIFKSKPNEFFINFKLYNALKNSQCFDIGYYLNYNEDIRKSSWCKYFSPELHYVCKGFDEKRRFNKKYFNRNSKKDLLKYIRECT